MPCASLLLLPPFPPLPARIDRFQGGPEDRAAMAADEPLGHASLDREEPEARRAELTRLLRAGPEGRVDEVDGDGVFQQRVMRVVVRHHRARDRKPAVLADARAGRSDDFNY